MKNEHIPGAQNDEYPHFKRGLPVDYWIHQSRGSNPNVPLKVLIMYVTNISLQVQIEVVRDFETTAHITKPPVPTDHVFIFLVDHLLESKLRRFFSICAWIYSISKLHKPFGVKKKVAKDYIHNHQFRFPKTNRCNLKMVACLSQKQKKSDFEASLIVFRLQQLFEICSKS